MGLNTDSRAGLVATPDEMPVVPVRFLINFPHHDTTK